MMSGWMRKSSLVLGSVASSDPFWGDEFQAGLVVLGDGDAL